MLRATSIRPQYSFPHHACWHGEEEEDQTKIKPSTITPSGAIEHQRRGRSAKVVINNNAGKQ
jgi:hypothetical protein